jgi:hypothetical protein
MFENYQLIHDGLLAEARRGLLELAAQSGGGSREAVAARPREAPGEMAVGEGGSGWTVLGVWQQDEPITIGAVRGDHWVHGGDDAFPEGTWATYVVAGDVSEAEAAAIEEVRSWNKRRIDYEGGNDV